MTTAPLTTTCPSAISLPSRVRDRLAASGTSRESALSRRAGGSAAIRTTSGVEPMKNSPETQPVDPALVRYLRILVTVLTVTMILGFIVIVVLFVTKFSDAFKTDLPDCDHPARRQRSGGVHPRKRLVCGGDGR